MAEPHSSLENIIATAGDKVVAELRASADTGQRNSSADIRSEKNAESEISADLSGALDEIQKDWMIIIEKVQTPEEYVRLRKSIVITEKTKEGEGPTDIRFFPLDEIKDSLQRDLTNDEVTVISQLKREIEQAVQKKLHELVRTDLLIQFNYRETEINTVTNEKDLDALVEKLQITHTLSDVLLDQIPEREARIDKRIADTEFLKCVEAVNRVIREKREELLKPLQDMMDSIRKKCKEKESEAKILVEVLPGDKKGKQQGNFSKFSSYLYSLRSAAKDAFEKRNIDDLKRALSDVNEAKFVVKEGKKVTSEKKKEYSGEELFAVLVEALRSKRRPFGKDKEGEELVIEEISESGTEIKYHYGEKKGLKVTPKYVKKFLQFLDDEFQWKLIMPRAKKVSPLSTEPVVDTTKTPEETKTENAGEVYEKIFQKLGKNTLEIELEEDRLKSTLAAGLQEMNTLLEGRNLVEFVNENKNDITQALSLSIMIRLDQLPMDASEKQLFARMFIEKYFAERIQ